ncbi:hypothetical protein GW756_05890 [bacterium]|nr:hypothetical protein [bacterium]NCQ55951.1 hypothetical protein [Candidatus Parcubacteria bacterium]NCS67976.1 hypothetical protein [Candidatus Peregrinibacteria bacterium]NCS96870.1 hypothetical protein [bacterium]
MRITPETEVASLIDVDLLKKRIAEKEVGDPEREILLRVQKTGHLIPSRLIAYRNYIRALTVQACGALHEMPGNDRTVPNCPIKQTNVACLHGLDFRYIGNDRSRGGKGIIGGNNIWGLSVLSLAYVLRERGYEAPEFEEFLRASNKKLINTDDAVRNNYQNSYLARLFNEPVPKKLDSTAIDLQQYLGDRFMEEYVIPTREALEAFWAAEVSEN